MNLEKKRLRVMILSDGTGKTAKDLIRASMTQFDNQDFVFTIKKNLRTTEQIDQCFLEAKINYDLVVYTIVDKELRDYIKEQINLYNIDVIDLMGPVLDSFSKSFEVAPKYRPGVLRSVDESYFQRISALEFTLNHDNGSHVDTLTEADIVLVGISRTSKTPLAVFLSLEGLKVVNIPINFQEELPSELFEIDQKKIFGLTIKPDALQGIRKNRVKRRKDEKKPSNYTKIDQITQEVFWAEKLFEKNTLWPVFDVTNISLEEVASEILKLIEMRLKNSEKQSKRFN